MDLNPPGRGHPLDFLTILELGTWWCLDVTRPFPDSSCLSFSWQKDFENISNHLSFSRSTSE